MTQSTWLIIRSKHEALWTVGFYDSNGKWHAHEDHDTQTAAEAQVHYLNGGAK